MIEPSVLFSMSSAFKLTSSLVLGVSSTLCWNTPSGLVSKTRLESFYLCRLLWHPSRSLSFPSVRIPRSGPRFRRSVRLYFARPAHAYIQPRRFAGRVSPAVLTIAQFLSARNTPDLMKSLSRWESVWTLQVSLNQCVDNHRSL